MTHGDFSSWYGQAEIYGGQIFLERRTYNSKVYIYIYMVDVTRVKFLHGGLSIIRWAFPWHIFFYYIYRGKAKKIWWRALYNMVEGNFERTRWWRAKRIHMLASICICLIWQTLFKCGQVIKKKASRQVHYVNIYKAITWRRPLFGLWQITWWTPY